MGSAALNTNYEVDPVTKLWQQCQPLVKDCCKQHENDAIVVCFLDCWGRSINRRLGEYVNKA